MISEQEQKRIVAEMLNKALERKENREMLRRLADKEVKQVVLITNEYQLGEVARMNTPNIDIKIDIKE